MLLRIRDKAGIPREPFFHRINLEEIRYRIFLPVFSTVGEKGYSNDAYFNAFFFIWIDLWLRFKYLFAGNPICCETVYLTNCDRLCFDDRNTYKTATVRMLNENYREQKKLYLNDSKKYFVHENQKFSFI